MGPTSSTARKFEILHAIVKAYIETGEPVASRSISRARKDHLSPASVRNVMADLCDEGYLAQPHTSAGRVPTQKAFRSYINSLMATNRLLTAELARLRAELDEAGTMEGRVERTSRMLTDMTRGVGIVAAIPSGSQTLDQVELLAVGNRRVLMILVTKDGAVRQRLVVLDEPISQQQLESIRNYVNREFSGWTLEATRQELVRRLEQESAAYDAILRHLMVLNSKGLLEIGLSPEIHLEGASNLIGLDLHLTREKTRELFQALEEKKRLLQLLERFLESADGELAVHVGLGEAHPSMSELSLIGLSVLLPAGIRAKVAVLGPMRMDYGRVMSAVLHVGQALRSVA
ncbi:MAG TPA: heat-inducible transcriptional repressor HrcA [Bryobacteraceae bacterium]|jgi:heat-inducible transcriptional repressor|nr:heat-inducible transcriptional repressor HrcA [Bryobacteraceae bacterium]